MGVLWRWRCVYRLAGWLCLGETRVSVVCLDVLCAVMFRLGASCFLPVVFARCASKDYVDIRPSLVLPRVSECAHGQWAKPIRYLACLL